MGKQKSPAPDSGLGISVFRGPPCSGGCRQGRRHNSRAIHRCFFCSGQIWDGLSLGHVRNRYVAFSEGVMVLDELLVFYIRITQLYKLQTKIKAVSLYAFYSFRIK